MPPRLTCSTRLFLDFRRLRDCGRRVRRGVVILLISLAACGPYPRDIEGTLDRVERTHVIRVGLVEGTTGIDRTTSFLNDLGRATGARVQPTTGSAEPLIAALDADQLDLVIGEVATDSPWVKDVAVIEPLVTRRVGKSDLGLSPIARNGENRWIMLLERQAREAAGK